MKLKKRKFDKKAQKRKIAQRSLPVEPEIVSKIKLSDYPIVGGKPLFSIIASSVRNSFETFYCNVRSNNIPFEIIWVGPNPPKEKLPSNFTHIQTDAKPAQCIEIAARRAKGDYIITGADDLIFSENYLDKMAFYIPKFDMDKFIFLNRFKIGRGIFEYCCFWDQPRVPLTMAVFMVKREKWHELGGVDKRYDTIFWDVDLQLRCYEAGMNPFIVPECLATEWDTSPKTCGSPRLTERDSAKTQQDFTSSLWIKEDGSFSHNRLSPVQSFSDIDILIKDQ